MALDEHAIRLLQHITDPAAKPLAELTLHEVRENSRTRIKELDPDPVEVGGVADFIADGVPVRVYRPLIAEEQPPVLMYFHGGGWVVCGLDTHDKTCRRLANASGAVVVSVDYRLAPEHPFPAAVEDCFSALEWVATHAGQLGVDGSRIAVSGDSAGGNLAAVCALLAREKGGPAISAQVLIVPVTAPIADSGSYSDNAVGCWLTRELMDWFFVRYLSKEEDRSDWRAFPMLADSFRGMPPALVLTAEHDPLRDEGEAYARRMAASGVEVVLRRFDGTVHQFCVVPTWLPQGAMALGEIGAWLRGKFARS